MSHSHRYTGKKGNVGSRTAWVRAASVRLLLLLVFWRMLTQGDPTSWVIGIPTVLLATIISLWLSASSPWGWRFSSFFRFIPLFAYCSLKGGVDVASRAFRPSLPLAPAMLDYTLQLPEGTARVFFANVVSLLPGTLSADIRGDTLLVHMLDDTLPARMQLERFEVTGARLFGWTIALEIAEGTEK